MAFDSTADRALMLGEFCGDGESTFATPASVSGTNITINLNTGETGVYASFDAVDDDGAAINLSTKGDLVLVIESRSTQEDVQVVEMADLTVSGTDNNTVTFLPSAATLSTVRRLRFALRQASSGLTLSRGAVQVSYVASQD